MQKLVYYFGDRQTEGKAEMRDLLGGKGANLAEMCNLGLPVPHGFTISTEVCTYYYNNNKSLPEKLKLEIKKNELREEVDGTYLGFLNSFPGHWT